MTKLRACCVAVLASGLLACPGSAMEEPRPSAQPSPPAAKSRADRYAALREEMVRDQIEARGVRDARVLAAMRRVQRHDYVPEDDLARAYDDRPLPIRHGQTISQPYIVALMSELARVGPGKKVLEIGTGSGYQAAVLAEMGARVWSIEIVEPLAKSAEQALEKAGYGAVEVRHGDGYRGWKEHAPFDAIVLTAAPDEIPKPLLEQLAVGGRLVAPVGTWVQKLVVVTRTADGYVEEDVLPVRFVPMTGEAEKDS